MKIDLHGKRVVITGATRGVGRAIALGFAESGARLALCARNVHGIDEFTTRLRDLGSDEVVAVSADVTDRDQVANFMSDLIVAWGGVDILINNAGQTLGGTLDTVSAEDILEHSRIDQIAHFRLIQAVVPSMRSQHWGRIININAVIGHESAPFALPAQMNRAACIALSHALGMSLAEDNILVNSVNLGWIDTQQWSRLHEFYAPHSTYERFRSTSCKVVPMGRLGRPEEVVGLVLFLASEHASYITAASIDVAGGLGGQIAYFPTLMAELAGMDTKVNSPTAGMR